LPNGRSLSTSLNEDLDPEFINSKATETEKTTMKAKTQQKPAFEISATAEDPEITEFLKAQKRNTRNTYTTYFKRIVEFSHESGKELLANHENWERRIFALDQHLKEKGYSPNYCESVTGCLRGFFSYWRKSLNLTSTERQKLRKRTRTTEDYYLSSEDLAKMYLSGTTKNKYVVAVGKSIGLRAEDFSKLTYGQFRSIDLNAEAPVFFGEIQTEKEGVKAFCFLDKDAIEAVKALLDQNKDKPDQKQIWTARSEDLSPLLRRLADKSNIKYGNRRIRFHCLRKFLADNLSRIMSESKWKQVIGKQISESAYVSPETLKEDFKNVMHYIAFNGNGVKAKVSDLEQKLLEKDALIKQLQDQLSQTQTQQNKSEELLNNLNERLTHFEKFGRPKKSTDKFR
jgi:uncharacterized coiled-coil protein SlyX/integrase